MKVVRGPFDLLDREIGLHGSLDRASIKFVGQETEAEHSRKFFLFSPFQLTLHRVTWLVSGLPEIAFQREKLHERWDEARYQ